MTSLSWSPWLAVLGDSPLCYFGSCAFQGIIASPSSWAPHLRTFGGFQNGSAVPGSSSWSLVMKVRVIMNEGGKWHSGWQDRPAPPARMCQSVLTSPEAQLFLDTKTRGNLPGNEGCSPEIKLGVSAPSVEILTVLLRERGDLWGKLPEHGVLECGDVLSGREGSFPFWKIPPFSREPRSLGRLCSSWLGDLRLWLKCISFLTCPAWSDTKWPLLPPTLL